MFLSRCTVGRARYTVNFFTASFAHFTCTCHFLGVLSGAFGGARAAWGAWGGLWRVSGGLWGLCGSLGSLGVGWWPHSVQGSWDDACFAPSVYHSCQCPGNPMGNEMTTSTSDTQGVTPCHVARPVCRPTKEGTMDGNSGALLFILDGTAQPDPPSLAKATHEQTKWAFCFCILSFPLGLDIRLLDIRFAWW